MTRGYIVILDGKKIKRVVYSNSDSYFCKDENLPAGLILKAMSSDDVLTELNKRLDEQVKKEYLGEETTFFKDNDEYKFYVKTKKNENDFFVDYVYEYNTKTKKLTVYYYGKKMFQFTQDNLEYMDYIFENENNFYDAYSYDEESCTRKQDWIKMFNQFMKDNVPIDEIKANVNNLISRNRFIISPFKTVDCWGENHYKKLVAVYDTTGKRIHEYEFCFAPINTFDKNSKYYEMNIQLPYIRCTLFYSKDVYGKKLYSEKALYKEFIEYLKDEAVQKELINAIPLFGIYKKYSTEFKSLWETIKKLNTKEEQVNAFNNCEKDFFTRLNKELRTYDDMSFSHMMRGKGKVFNANAVRREIEETWHNAINYWIDSEFRKKSDV